MSNCFLFLYIGVLYSFYDNGHDITLFSLLLQISTIWVGSLLMDNITRLYNGRWNLKCHVTMSKKKNLFMFNSCPYACGLWFFRIRRVIARGAVSFLRCKYIILQVYRTVRIFCPFPFNFRFFHFSLACFNANWQPELPHDHKPLACQFVRDQPPPSWAKSTKPRTSAPRSSTPSSLSLSPIQASSAGSNIIGPRSLSRSLKVLTSWPPRVPFIYINCGGERHWPDGMVTRKRRWWRSSNDGGTHDLTKVDGSGERETESHGFLVQFFR